MAMSELSCRKALLALGGPFLSSFPQIGFESSSLALWGQCPNPRELGVWYVRLKVTSKE